MYRMGQEELDEVRKVIEAKKLFMVGDPAQGHQQEVVRFEREWAGKIGVKYALCLSGGGTAALMCGLAALGIGPGDEVIVPSYTFMASATAVLAAGAIPVIASRACSTRTTSSESSVRTSRPSSPFTWSACRATWTASWPWRARTG